MPSIQDALQFPATIEEFPLSCKAKNAVVRLELHSLKNKLWFKMERKIVMKKPMVLAALLLATSVALTACGNGTSGTQQDAQTGSKKLVVWDWADAYKGDAKKATDDVIAKYKKDNPGVELEVEPIANDDIRTKLLSAVAAGNVPDVAYIDGQNLAEFQSTGMLADLSAYAEKWGQKSDYPEEVWKTVVFDNKVCGIPGDGDVRTLIYRKDLFKKAGIQNAPKTWAELEADAKKLTQTQDGKTSVWGFAMNGGDSEHTTMRSLPWIWDLGGNLADDKGQPTLTDPAVVKTLTFMNKLVNEDKVCPPDSYMNTKKQVANLLNGGNAAMAIVGSWEWNGDSNYLKNTYKDQFASAPIPVPDGSKVSESYTAAGYGTWVIFDKSGNKDAAWKWIDDCTTKEHMIDIFKNGTGNLGLRKSVVADPVFSENDAFKSFVEVVPHSKARPNSQYYDAISSQYRGAVQKVLSKQADPQKALQDAQAAAVASAK